MVVEDLLDDRDDLFWCGIFAGRADEAAVAEGFEVRDLAGGVEGGEFFHGFWEGDVPGVDEFGFG